MAYILQEYSALPWLNVEQNIAYGLKIKGYDKQTIKARVEEASAMVNLQEYLHYYPSELSASMLQRVVIARAFATKPELLLMDEPYGQLDLNLKYKLEDELLELWKQTGTTIIFITHNIEEAVYLSDRILVMTNKPTGVKTELINNLPRPRKVASKDFVTLRNQVTDLIKWW
jgi:sulfonate transport system ATP-binding protein